jgi:hypothetical protein
MLLKNAFTTSQRLTSESEHVRVQEMRTSLISERTNLSLGPLLRHIILLLIPLRIIQLAVLHHV